MVKTINYCSGVFTMIAWLAGVVYYKSASVPFWEASVIAVVGALAASIFIANTLSAIAAAITYKLTGDPESATDFASIAVIVSPTLAFFAAKYAIQWAGVSSFG
jgi:hypothetical protein